MASAAGGGSESENVDPEREEKLSKLKKGIRAILQTSLKTGLSPEDLERDYRDLNGRPMPYKEFGFNDIYDLLDSMPDVVDAYEVNGSILLFAKSTKATARLEDLISKARPTRLGRFGGIIQQPAALRHGTPERRKLIETRLLDVALNYPDYVSYYELYNAYQTIYHETLDCRNDFMCSPKGVFDIKLGHLFEVKDISGEGSFAVRVKSEVRKEKAKKGNNSKNEQRSPTNILGHGGFRKLSESPALVVSSFPVSVAENSSSIATGIPFATYPVSSGDLRPRISVFNSTGMCRPMPPQFLYFSPQPPFIPPFRPMHIGPPPMAPPLMFRPTTTGPYFHQPMPPMTLYGGSDTQYAQQPMCRVSYPFPPARLFMDVQGPAQTWPNVQRPQREGEPLPDVTVVTTTAADKEPEQLTSQNDVARAPDVPLLPPASELFKDFMAIPPTIPSSYNVTTRSNSTNDIPDVARLQSSEMQKSISEKTDASASTEVLAAPSITGTDIDDDNKDDADDAKKKPLDTESPPSLTGRSQAKEILEAECKRVLSRFPSGIPYLEFGKAYLDVIGKELDLAPYNVLSVSDMVEDILPDVFEQRIDQKGIAHLFAKGSAASQQQEQQETDPEEALVSEVWRVTMQSPGRTLSIHQIPQAYKDITGKPFQMQGEKELDDFGLRLFSYTDRFTFIYEGKLRIVASPEYDEEFSSTQDTLNTVDEGRATDKAYVQQGECYQQQSLPVTRAQVEFLDFTDPRRFIQVFMAQVHTPGQFYIQLTSTFRDLEILISELNDRLVEGSDSVDNKIDPSNIQSGLPCACLCDEDNVWYRGSITRIIDEQSTAVMLVDFGTEIAVSNANIRYLPREFFNLPSQAIEAKLAVLSPRGEAWTTAGGERLAELCGSSKLSAEIYKIDEEGVAEVFLTVSNDNGKETVISEALIELGFAVFNETEAAKMSNDQRLNALSAQLEEEIESIQPGGVAADANEYTEAHSEAIKALSTVLEQEVMRELESAVNRGCGDLDSVYMASAYLSRRRLTITKLMMQPSMDPVLMPVATDKLSWLEKKIAWLEGLCG